MITYIPEKQLFFLQSSTISYVMQVVGGRLMHLYFGAPVDCEDINGLRHYYDHPFSPQPDNAPDSSYSLDTRAPEYGTFGTGDFHIPFADFVHDGKHVTDFFYCSHRIEREKPKIKGMPSLRDGETLVVTLEDKTARLRLELFYTVYDEGALARRASVVNTGEQPVSVRKLSGGGVTLPEGAFDLIELDGRHEGERTVARMPLSGGVHTVGSTRGVSSHQRNPFVALVGRHTTEEAGEAYGFQLIYSGNFAIEAEYDQFHKTRVVAGLHPQTTDFTLNAGDRLDSPEMVMVYSGAGLGQMSRNFHDLYRKHLINPKFVNAPRPVVINSWEGCYFDFDEDKICAFVEGVQGCGIDMLVLDDGWFGRRNDDRSSLGDWTCHKKLEHGLHKIIDCCKAHGMKFGLWFEPEMVSEDSDLYRAHPDFCLHTAGYGHTRGRNQLVLDFSRKEVVDNIYAQMERVLLDYEISYIKWDMNRALTNVPHLSDYHGYVLGVYDLYERLSARFPDVMIEGCCSGGGRFDPAILYYSPQIWTSDNTDAYFRAQIQFGTSLCYPLSSMSNHVSVSPNHQTRHAVPFATRAAVASLGAFGYELDPAKLTDGEKSEMKKQIADYRRVQRLILEGDLYRLLSPFEGETFCEQVVAKDRSESLIVFTKAQNYYNCVQNRLYLRGLDPDLTYEIEETGQRYTGRTLMRAGITVPLLFGDYQSVVYRLAAV